MPLIIIIYSTTIVRSNRRQRPPPPPPPPWFKWTTFFEIGRTAQFQTAHGYGGVRAHLHICTATDQEGVCNFICDYLLSVSVNARRKHLAGLSRTTTTYGTVVNGILQRYSWHAALFACQKRRIKA